MDNNLNIESLLGSISNNINLSFVLGEQNSDGIQLLNTLMLTYDYTLARLEQGLDYNEQLGKLAKLIEELKKSCRQICRIGNRIIIPGGNSGGDDGGNNDVPNTAPRISDNEKTYCFQDTLPRSLNLSDFIFDYEDDEGHGISEIIFLSNSGNILIDSNPLIVNNIYTPNITVSMGDGELQNDYVYLIKNVGGSNPCEGKIIKILEQDYIDNYFNCNVLDIHDDTTNETVFQCLERTQTTLPNDTIVYIDIDRTGSFSDEDTTNIENTVFQWWNTFKTNNPNFAGSLIINDVDNSVIDNTHAPGFGGDTFGDILDLSVEVETYERWLNAPVKALLRQMYKEGIVSLPGLDEFKGFVKNRSLVILSFINESNPKYHGFSAGFNSDNIIQPSNSYTTDYTIFKEYIYPYLKSFKGILYPVIKNAGTIRPFILHSLAAFEATILSSSQIDSILSLPVVSLLTVTQMQNYVYTPLGAGNPYSTLPDLRAMDWNIIYKTSPIIDVLTSQDFADTLDNLLILDQLLVVDELVEVRVPSEESTFESETTIQVRDDHPTDPLLSNVATVKIIFEGCCEETPQCETSTVKNIDHRETYAIAWSDLATEPNVDKIKLTSFVIPNGQLKYYNIFLSASDLPLIITKSDVDLGNLIYIPDDSYQGEYNVELFYQNAFQNRDNYCDSDNELIIVKEENPNQPPIITFKNGDETITIPSGDTDIDHIIDANIQYTGTGGYDIYWTKISTPNTTIFVNPHQEDLEVQNLVVGTHRFNIRVITHDDNFIVDRQVTITVI